jgi:hypothetical protein
MPCTWSLTSGHLPSGLSFGPDGTIAGWPYFALAGSDPIVVTVTDATGTAAQATVTLAVP